jgi:hypothetical protein
MARPDRAKRVDPSQADGYAEVGRRLLGAGRAIREGGDARHAPALAILGIHAVVAFTDALCIHLGGRKSTSADHGAAARLLRAIVGARLPREMETLLVRVVSEKDRLEYQGYVATMREADAIFARAERYGRWVEQWLTGSTASG